MRKQKVNYPCRCIDILRREPASVEKPVENSDTALSSLSLMSLYHDNSDNNDTDNDKRIFGFQIPQSTEKPYPDNNDTVLVSVTNSGDFFGY
jgi:hypothetical protein